MMSNNCSGLKKKIIQERCEGNKISNPSDVAEPNIRQNVDDLEKGQQSSDAQYYHIYASIFPDASDDKTNDDATNNDSAYRSAGHGQVNEGNTTDTLSGHHFDDQETSVQDVVPDEERHDPPRSSGRPNIVKYGDKKTITSFIKNVRNTTDGSGVILKKFSSLLTINDGRYSEDTDFKIINPFLLGNVSICTDKSSRNRFVIKKILVEKFLQNKQQLLIPLEIQDACFSIVKTYGVLKYSGFICILMEYCGGSIEVNNLINWTSNNYKKFAIKLLEVVRFLHNLDIAHCDLKLANICFRDASDPTSLCLIDFDSVTNPQYPNVKKVTIPNLPPWYKQHCYTQDWTSDLKTLDCWCIGIILCTLITKRFPWPELQTMKGVGCQWEKVNHISKHHSEISKIYPNNAENQGCSVLLSNVIKGLLLTSGKIDEQWTAKKALNVLQGTEDCGVQIQIFYQGQVVSCIWVPTDTKIKSLVKNPEFLSLIENLKKKNEDFLLGHFLRKRQKEGPGLFKFGSYRISEDTDFNICPPIQ